MSTTDDHPKESNHGLDHNKEFDGIRQADNLMPPWYVVSFIATMVIGVLYLVYYHGIQSWTATAQYRREVAAHAVAYPSAQPVDTAALTGNPYAGDAAAIAAGAESFQAMCAACHKADGTGLIGPNLTDAEWLHGNSDLALYDVIMEGRMLPEQLKQVPPKGPMPSHKASLGSQRVWEVLAYLQDKHGNIETAAAPADGGDAAAEGSP